MAASPPSPTFIPEHVFPFSARKSACLGVAYMKNTFLAGVKFMPVGTRAKPVRANDDFEDVGEMILW